MILSMTEAREALRVDGNDNDEIIQAILDSIPSYLEATTGHDWAADITVHPLAKTVSKFILEHWFDTQSEDSIRLQRTINLLLGTLTAIGRGYDG